MLPCCLALMRPSPVHGMASTATAAAAHSTQALGLSPNALQTLLAVAGIGCCIAMAMPQVHIVAYCVDLGYGPARGAEMLAILSAGGVISRIASGWIAAFSAFLLFLGVQILSIGYFFVLHELWAGGLLALAMGLYRPEKGKWLGAWIAAAAALSLREHALPFVLLLGAFALWHRRWKEFGAWALLTGLFIAAMAVHLHTVAGLVRGSDPVGPSWLTLRGLSGWMSMVVLSSNLRLIPAMLAGPLMVLMVFGWAGWRTPIATFATLLFLGYGLAFMIGGRGDNWYWGMMIAPMMWLGLAFVPMALKGLASAAFPSAKAAASSESA